MDNVNHAINLIGGVIAAGLGIGLLMSWLFYLRTKRIIQRGADADTVARAAWQTYLQGAGSPNEAKLLAGSLLSTGGMAELSALQLLCTIAIRQRQIDELQDFASRGLALSERLLKNPVVKAARVNFARVYFMDCLAFVLSEQGKFRQALELLEDALKLAQKLEATASLRRDVIAPLCEDLATLSSEIAKQLGDEHEDSAYYLEKEDFYREQARQNWALPADEYREPDSASVAYRSRLERLYRIDPPDKDGSDYDR